MTVRRSDELLALARRRRAEVAAACARHGCRNPRVVGSVAAGDADSDLDLMVDVDDVRTPFDLALAGSS